MKTLQLNGKIRKISEFLRVCEWDANASRLQNVLNFRLTRIRDCSVYIDAEAKIVEIWIQYKDIDDDEFYVEEKHFLFPKEDVDLTKISLAGLERRCQHRSSWTAPEFFEIIRRAGLNACGKTQDEYMDVLWAAGRALDVQMCRICDSLSDVSTYGEGFFFFRFRHSAGLRPCFEADSHFKTFSHFIPPCVQQMIFFSVLADDQMY